MAKISEFCFEAMGIQPGISIPFPYGGHHEPPRRLYA